MKAAITVLIVFLSFTLYFSMGFVIANLRIPQTWRIARRAHSHYDSVLESVKEQYWMNAILWPVYTTISLVVQGFKAFHWFTGLEQRVLRYDPDPQQQRSSRW